MKEDRKIIMIAAAGENNSLGKDNDLLWHLPDDFKRFKRLTSGHKIIMGRKTFETFPKPLPNRIHIIITREQDYSTDFDDCIIVHSLEEALQLVDNETAYIIGGGEIYKQGEIYSDAVELTRVHANFDADTFFPILNEDVWEVVAQEYHPKDERHLYDFTYVTYERKED